MFIHPFLQLHSVRATLPLTIPSVIAKQISSNALFPHKGKWLKSGHYVLPVGIPAHKGRSRAQCCVATIQSELLGEVSIHRGYSDPMVDMLGGCLEWEEGGSFQRYPEISPT